MQKEFRGNKLKLLEQNGFATLSATNFRSFFDTIAAKKGRVLVLKFIDDIDAVSADHARALKKLSSFLDGETFVIGKKRKGKQIADNLKLQRHGVSCITYDTLELVLGNVHIKKVERFIGARCVVDGTTLRKLRKLSGLSTRKLGSTVGLSKDSIYRYENNMQAITKANLAKLESFFATPLSSPEENESVSQRYCRFMDFDGVSMLQLSKDPFEILAKGNSRYEIGRTANERTMSKWAGLYLALNQMFGDYPFFITKNKRGKNSLNGVPIISKEELNNTTTEGSLLELVTTRSKFY